MGFGELKSFKVSVKLPHIIKDESEITNLHPGIKIVHLSSEPTKSCVLEFKDSLTQNKVVKELRKTKIEDKLIVVKKLKQLKSASFKFTIISLTDKVAIDKRISLLIN